MIRVGIAMPQKFYGSDIYALVQHFADDSEVRYVLAEDPGDLDASDVDVVHQMMGYDPPWRRYPRPRIHDYASLSTPPLAPLKDWVKRSAQPRPVLRSFLSPYVRDRLSFAGDTPWVLRDMGVPESFYREQEVADGTQRTYDVGYAGSLTVSRGIGDALRQLAESGFRLLLVGEPDTAIRDSLAEFNHVTFAGRLAQEAVPEALETCRYGFNFVPDHRPYNQQTATKVLEYSALGLHVITNDYPWVRRFQEMHGAVFAVLDPQRALTPELVDNLPLRRANPEPFRWKTVIEGSGLKEAIMRAVRES